MRRGGRRVWWQVAVLAAGLIAATASMNSATPRLKFLPQHGARRVPVVLIAFDEFPTASLMNRAGAVDKRAYPNFAELAGSSTWYRNATSVGTFTKEALPALLTGTYPPSRPINDPPFFPHNIFTLLGGAYDIHAVGQLPRLCPRLCVAGHTLKRILPPEYSVFEAGSRGETFTSFLQTLKPRTKPAFYFVHLVLPHSPWRFLPSAQRYTEAEPIPGEVDPLGRGHAWTSKRWPVAQAWERHLLQVQLVDDLLGFVVQRMKDAGLYRRSLLVVTADHGVAFEPGLPTRLLRPQTAGQLAFVPLFVKQPGQISGSPSDEPAESVDIVPTVADILDLSKTWPGVEGSSLQGRIDRDRARGFDGVEFSSNGDELRDAVARKYATFGRSSGSIAPFHLAPCGLSELIGKPTAEMSITESLARIRLTDEAALAAADGHDAVFPALVTGVVSGADERALIAIAVDGRIVSVTRAWERKKNGAGFAAMVSPHGFGPPPHDVTTYVVSGCDDPTLAAPPAEES